MKKSQRVQEKIINVTMDMIEENGGDIKAITTRAIALRAGVATGLVNYHFTSKDQLIDICVQRIIGRVIFAFRKNDGRASRDNLKVAMKQMCDFLLDNEAIARIAILGDMEAPNEEDTTSKITLGLLSIMNDSFTMEERARVAFIITSTLQAMILRKDCVMNQFGTDFSDKAMRDEFIDGLVNLLYHA